MRHQHNGLVFAWSVLVIMVTSCGSFHGLESLVEHMPPGEILFTFGNMDYLPFHLHWICNTMAWSRIHERTLIVTDHQAAMHAIRALSNRVQVFVLPETSTARGFYSKGYRQLTIQRLVILVEILKTGRSVIMFEGDAIWTRNVLQDANLTGPDRLHDLALYRDGMHGEMIGAGT